MNTFCLGRKLRASLSCAVLTCAGVLAGAAPTYAWSGPGHMAIAIVAYREMKPATRTQVDTLLKAHPDYVEWVKEVPADATPDQRSEDIFAIAATWPDRIKGGRDRSVTIKFVDEARGGDSAGPVPTDPHYPDLLKHQNWHYVDIPIVADGGDHPTPTPSALTQIPVCRDGLANDKNSPSFRAYYLAWLEHLVGDIHQPLHATSRYSTTYPRGDQGGNSVRMDAEFPGESANLHSYWDGLLTQPGPRPATPGGTNWAGVDATAAQIITDEPKTLAGYSKSVEDDLNPADWAQESWRYDRDFVYSFGVDKPGPIDPPDSAYHTTALMIAHQRGALAGHRLALMIDAALAAALTLADVSALTPADARTYNPAMDQPADDAVLSPGLTVNFLGSGTSTGVPMIGCDCAVCRSSNPRNKRMRPSILVTVDGEGGEAGANLLVDTTPEMRLQALRAGLGRLDSVLVTHQHADHILGMDDIRQFNFRQGTSIPIYSDAPTLDRLRVVFDYAFRETPPAGGKPQLELIEVTPPAPIVVNGVTVTPLTVMHGTLPIVAYKFGRRFAYVTDVSAIPGETRPHLYGLDTLVLGAIRHEEHPTHFTVAEAVEQIHELAPRRAFLTHITHKLDHDLENAALPPCIRLAHDGLVIRIPAERGAARP